MLVEKKDQFKTGTKMNSKIIGKPVPIIDAAEKVSGDTSYIDDFRLYNRPLSAFVVEELFESY